MDARLRAVALAQGGVLGARDARRIGLPVVVLDDLTRSRELIRVRRGAFVLRDLHDDADVDALYRLRTRAVLRTRPALDAASHHAAVMLAGIDTFGVDLHTIDVASAVKQSSVRSGLRTHPASGLPIVLARGTRLVDLATALVQVAAASGLVAGVASIDAALHARQCTPETLQDAVAHLPEHQRHRASDAVERSDPAAESVGESRTRLLLRDLGLRVRSQYVVASGSSFVGRVDFLVDDLVVVEFDGLVKYAGFEGRAALAAEKRRESAIVDLGYEVVRLTWADLADPAEVARRVRVARIRAIRRRGGTS